MSSLRDQLEAIHAQHGRLTPELVVQEARPKNHPLHKRVFDKAPREAAETYYRMRAHELIRSVRIVYREADETGPDRTIRAYHAVPRETGYVYEPAIEVASDDFTRQLVLREMERDWNRLRSRYEAFAEFTAMIRATLEEEAA